MNEFLHHPSVRPSAHPSIRPSIHPSIHPPIHPSIHPSILFHTKNVSSSCNNFFLSISSFIFSSFHPVVGVSDFTFDLSLPFRHILIFPILYSCKEALITPHPSIRPSIHPSVRSTNPPSITTDNSLHFNSLSIPNALPNALSFTGEIHSLIMIMASNKT